MKRCSRCRAEKATSEFHKSTGNWDGLGNYCKECSKISQREFQKKHPGYNRKFYNPEYCRTAEYRAKAAEYHQKTKNRPEVRARRALALRVWRKRHPDRSRAYGLQKEARLRGARVSEPVNRTVVFERDGGICQLQIHPHCPVSLNPDNWHLDHIIPLSRHGEHSYMNTQASCPPCNQMKFNHIYAEVI